MIVHDPDNWRAEFVKLLSSAVPENWAKGVALKNSKMPDRLYQYRKPTKYAFEGLMNRSGWLSRASEFNDLFDTTAEVDAVRVLNHLSQKTLHDGSLPPELQALIPADASNFIEAMEAAFVKIVEKDHGGEIAKKALGFFTNVTKKQGAEMTKRVSAFSQARTKVACFCEVHDDPHMWGLYAEGNRGFCLEYLFTELEPDDLRLRWMMPVVYQAQPFDVAEMLIRLDGRLTPFGGFLTSIHKSLKWADEREWRLIDMIGDDSVGRQILLPIPSRIFLGQRMTDENREFVSTIAQEQGIAVFEMRSAEGFTFEAAPVDRGKGTA